MVSTNDKAHFSGHNTWAAVLPSLSNMCACFGVKAVKITLGLNPWEEKDLSGYIASLKSNFNYTTI